MIIKTKLEDMNIDFDTSEFFFIEEYDLINTITLDYKRISEIDDDDDSVIWEYKEQLIIDRETETLQHKEIVNTGCVVTKKYEVKNAVKKFLDELDPDELFNSDLDKSKQKIGEQKETRDYKIVVEYKSGSQKFFFGTFDKDGLPNDYDKFIKKVSHFMNYFDLSEIFNESIYSKGTKLSADYILCSVVFNNGYKTYYYLTDDDTIKIGDFVVVPAGYDNHEEVVEVVEIEYFSKDNIPFPIDKIKYVISKF